MKLNYKRTILVGFAFFLISAFWQAYDATIPVILTNKFGMSQTWSGVIMALDNILAVFMLPLFGALSDKCRSKHGKRTPFIVIGTIIAAVAIFSLSFVDNAQLRNIEPVAGIDEPAALSVIYDAQKDTQLQTPDGESYVLADMYTREEFMEIRTEATLDVDGKQVSPYTNYVVPARQAYAAAKTAENPTPLILFVALLLLVLVAMATFRSPAVALMPDVTVKPLRSKGNAVINLMGTAGGILVLVLGMVFATSAVRNQLMSYNLYYGVIAGLMIVSLVIFLATVREPAWAEQMRKDSLKYGIEEEQETDSGDKRKLSSGEKRSLIFILASIALWYFGYNAVTSKYSVYAGNILNMDYNTTLLIAQGAAILAYLPAGMVASKLGRKKTIMAGVVMLTVAFGAASFLRAGSPVMLMNVLFALAGIGWATINVNSFPMVVELCSGGDVGKYTGFYYTASMSAQIVTPMLSGFFMDMDGVGMTVLFPYAAIFAGLAFLTMAMVKHGDAKPEAKTGLEALDIDD
ncbi:MAG: MFS transporter [Oscillospiraceae bacterium]|nr:MFS transporter [Oscillospiraceae bacterium]